MGSFQGLSTAELKNDWLRLEYLNRAGPRIVRLSAFGKGNLFAEIPRSLITAYGEFFFLGGHRLWSAPESIPRTYIPDNDGLTQEALENGVLLQGAPESGSGIAKSMRIELLAGRPAVRVEHRLRNTGLWAVELAPWALTMFRLGGTVILPQPVGPADRDGLLHNRILALWPYSKIQDPRLALGDDFILIRAFSAPQPFKLGYYNPHGWIAYWLDGVLFRKVFDVPGGAAFPDGGCNTESYCNDQFVELESLGPLVKLGPGQEASFTETWEFYPDLHVPFLPPRVREALG